MFFFAGLITAILYFSAIAITLDFFHFHYGVAVTVAYTVAALFQFLFNQKVSFDPSESPIVHQMSKYVGMIFINYLTTMLVLRIFVNHMGGTPYVGAMIGLFITTPMGYVMFRYWVYR